MKYKNVKIERLVKSQDGYIISAITEDGRRVWPYVEERKNDGTYWLVNASGEYTENSSKFKNRKIFFK